LFLYKQGETTKQAHKGIPQGKFEEEQGRKGFFGPVSHLIRKSPSTRWKSIEGDLKPRMYDLVGAAENTKGSQRLFFNADIEVSLEWAFPSLEKKLGAFRNADGDLIYFCHQGRGVVLTEYGLLNYRPGDYVVMPKCVAHTWVPEEASQFLTIQANGGGFWEPDRGIVGRHGVYDPMQIDPPDLKALDDFLAKQRIEVLTISVRHNQTITRFEYEETIFDVVGWKGDFFPFRLNLDQIMPLISHRAHLPPSAHTTFVAPNFVVCSFVPRPVESDADALKLPFYHQNIDYDEILFYHDGDFFSRANLHPGMLSFHPAGFPHGPHPKSFKTIEGKTFHTENAVMIDTRRPLERDPFLAGVELANYWKSWQE
jgi:homogentisate 1,2-dioxygenase